MTDKPRQYNMMPHTVADTKKRRPKAKWV